MKYLSRGPFRSPALLTATICVIGAVALLFVSGSIRYQGGVIVNLAHLLALTVLFAAPGAVLIVATLILDVLGRRFSQVMRWGLAGSAVACLACTALAFAANCVPYCKGRGSLEAGLWFAFPAGFAAGNVCYLVWLAASLQRYFNSDPDFELPDPRPHERLNELPLEEQERDQQRG